MALRCRGAGAVHPITSPFVDILYSFANLTKLQFIIANMRQEKFPQMTIMVRKLRGLLRRLLLVGVFVYAGFVIPIMSAQAELIRVTGAVWCPNNCYPSKEKPGIMIEIARAAFQSFGYDLAYTELPWTRAVTLTAYGSFDALIGPARGDAPDLVYPEEPIAFSQNCFFSLRDTNWNYYDISSLTKVSLGVGKDETVDDEIRSYIEKNRGSLRILEIGGTDYMARLVELLKRNRVDAFIGDRAVVGYQLYKSRANEDIQNVGCTDQIVKIYLAFFPGLQNVETIVRSFDEGVRGLRRSGELELILARYHLGVVSDPP